MMLLNLHIQQKVIIRAITITGTGVAYTKNGLKNILKLLKKYPENITKQISISRG
jgi:hypothetical protein